MWRGYLISRWNGCRMCPRLSADRRGRIPAAIRCNPSGPDAGLRHGCGGCQRFKKQNSKHSAFAAVQGLHSLPALHGAGHRVFRGANGHSAPAPGWAADGPHQLHQRPARARLQTTHFLTATPVVRPQSACFSDRVAAFNAAFALLACQEIYVQLKDSVHPPASSCVAVGQAQNICWARPGLVNCIAVLASCSAAGGNYGATDLACHPIHASCCTGVGLVTGPGLVAVTTAFKANGGAGSHGAVGPADGGGSGPVA